MEAEATTTVPLEEFWRWLITHPNCVVRAGTPNCVLYDMPDLHWHFGEDLDGNLSVQLIRGKELLAEMRVIPNDVLYVQMTEDDEDSCLFELVMEPDGDGFLTYHFLMAHAMEGEEEDRPWAH